MAMVEATTTIDLGGETTTTTATTSEETSIDEIHIETIEERFEHKIRFYFFYQSWFCPFGYGVRLLYRLQIFIR